MRGGGYRSAPSDATNRSARPLAGAKGSGRELSPCHAPEFDAALQSGLSATLIGPDAVVKVHFPPALFVEARDRARTLRLWP